MRKFLASYLGVLLTLSVAAQTLPQPQTPPDSQDEDVLRITTQLVQVDAVVMDKNDQIIPDLKLSDFEVYENGKKQDLQFIEFVSGDTAPRSEGRIDVAGTTIEPNATRNLTAHDLRRVYAFVVDDLTIPFDDLTNVRTMLRDFVDKQMREGDLVAIVRVVGGRGILQQFTSDKQLLRRAINEITPQLTPYSAFNNLSSPGRINTTPSVAAAGEESGAVSLPAPGSGMAFEASPDGTNQGLRPLISLSVAGDVINSMKSLPGRKNMLLISGGLPLFEMTPSTTNVNGSPMQIQETRPFVQNVSQLINQLTDRASRAGVVINTMDIRGLKASRGVARYTDPGNEGRSALMPNGNGDATFGRSADMAQFDNQSLDTLAGHLGLQTLASATGGVSVVNTSDFRQGLDRVLARGSYYLLAYRPSESFDGKFHKLQIKVNRSGAKVYTRQGYVARADAPLGTQTKEDAIVRAAMSPLAKRDLDVTGTLQYRFTPENTAAIDINLAIDTNKIDFKQGADGKYQATFDVVGFLIDNTGKTQNGFSQTVHATFSPEEFKEAQQYGISYTGNVEVPHGIYQLRAVVRDTSTGRIGSMSQYIEVPDMSKKRLAVSSLFLYGVDLSQGKDAKPEPLTGLHQLKRQKDLRYAAIVYNPKMSGGKTQLTTRTIITRGDKVVFQGTEQPLTTTAQNGQAVKIDQLGLSKLQPGRYVLTMLVTDPQADKDSRTVVRSIDFILVD